MRPIRTALTAASTLALAVTGVALAEAPAHAAPVPTVPTSCQPRSTSAMLLTLGDDHQYFSAPDGGMASPTRTWAGSFSVSAENEPWQVDASSTRNSIALRDGGWATSQSMCLGRDEDSFRFFYKGTGTPGSTLDVRAVINADTGTYVQRYRVDVSAAGWHLSPSLGIPDYSASSIQVASLSFSADLPSDARPVLVDDVVVDPWRGRGW